MSPASLASHAHCCCHLLQGELLSWGAMVVRKEEDEAAPVIRVLAGLVQRQDLVSTT